MNNNNQNNNKYIIKLNIGGIYFHTTKETLLHYGNNFFTGILQDNIPSYRDDTGAYFIDRNGHLFEPLLDYLRTGKLYIPNNISRAAVLDEALFYCIKLPEYELWTEDKFDFCILEISAKYMARSKIFFRLYHESISKPEDVGEISTAGYWEVSKKRLLAKLIGILGQNGWELSQVLGTEHDDGSVPESYVFSKHYKCGGDFQQLIYLLKEKKL